MVPNFPQSHSLRTQNEEEKTGRQYLIKPPFLYTNKYMQKKKTMAKLIETYACIPSTERGRGILISADPKTNAILYCNGRSIIIRHLDKPLDIDVYTDHGYPTTVARFSPNGEWVASADVSGTVRIWGRYNDHVLKVEFRVLTGRVDDLMWSPDGMRIVASGDGKGKSFVRAFMYVGLSLFYFFNIFLILYMLFVFICAYIY